MKLLYEKYHSNRKLQKRIVDRRNFTYSNLIPLLNKFTGPSATVLDMGSGVGTLSFYLAKRTKKVIGVEISEKALKLAKENAQKFNLDNVEFLQGKGINKLVGDMKFSFVLCSEVLEHVEADDELIAQLSKVLLPKGVILISVPSLSAPLYKLGLLGKFDLEVGHLRRYSAEEISAKISSAGMKIVEIHKTEGVLRNSLFTNNLLGRLVRYLRWPIWLIVSAIDDVLVKLFGESQIIVIAKKK